MLFWIFVLFEGLSLEVALCCCGNLDFFLGRGSSGGGVDFDFVAGTFHCCITLTVSRSSQMSSSSAEAGGLLI